MTASSAMPHTAYIGIGSNLGAREEHCERAVALLAGCGGIRVRACSRWYETASAPPGQPDFINGAAEVETELKPQKLLAALQAIEVSLGRPPVRPKGEPRTIDLDLLLYDDLAIELPGLTIPHPGLAKRPFVLLPLCDIAPSLAHPLLGCTVRELASRCRASGAAGRIRRLPEDKERPA